MTRATRALYETITSVCAAGAMLLLGRVRLHWYEWLLLFVAVGLLWHQIMARIGKLPRSSLSLFRLPTAD